MGFESVELGPLTNNQRIDKDYNAGSRRREVSTLQFASTLRHMITEGEIDPKVTKVMVSLNPSFAFLNLSPE